MPSVTPIAPAIQWHEGMMLSPQHFQQNDHRNAQILSRHVHLLSAYHWGVQSLALDPLVLSNGLVRILQLEAIMPDGLIVQYSSTGAEIPPLEVDIRSFKARDLQQPLTIQLAIPPYSEENSPVTGEFPRYYSGEGTSVKDINADDNVVKIPILIPKLSLYVGDQVPPPYLSFPLLKIALQDEVFVRIPYTAPCFFVEKSSRLWKNCAQIAQKIREKATYLCDKWQNQTGTPMLEETSRVLRPLVMALPSLEEVLNAGFTHPYLLFQKLCTTVGLLSTLKLSQVPPILSPYQHTDIDGCMAPLLTLIHQYLESIELSFITVPFQQKSKLFYIDLIKTYVQEGEPFYVGLRCPNGMTETQVEDWMSDAVIASDNAVDAVRSKRITGAKRSLLSGSALYDLMPSRGVVIFEVINDPLYVQPNQNLNIFNPADSPDRRPSEIALYIRRTAASSQNTS